MNASRSHLAAPAALVKYFTRDEQTCYAHVVIDATAAASGLAFNHDSFDPPTPTVVVVSVIYLVDAFHESLGVLVLVLLVSTYVSC